MQNGYQFDYSPRDDAVSGANYESQITFLRLLSSQARQVSPLIPLFKNLNSFLDGHLSLQELDCRFRQGLS